MSSGISIQLRNQAMQHSYPLKVHTNNCNSIDPAESSLKGTKSPAGASAATDGDPQLLKDIIVPCSFQCNKDNTNSSTPGGDERNHNYSHLT